MSAKTDLAKLLMYVRDTRRQLARPVSVAEGVRITKKLRTAWALVERRHGNVVAGLDAYPYVRAQIMQWGMPRENAGEYLLNLQKLLSNLMAQGITVGAIKMQTRSRR